MSAAPGESAPSRGGGEGRLWWRVGIAGLRAARRPPAALPSNATALRLFERGRSLRPSGAASIPTGDGRLL
jgi:hypothetical protein